MAARFVSIAFAILVLLPSPALGQADTVPASEAVTLEPGDVIEVEIWREEDLSGRFSVDESGRVVLPLLGEKQVADIPLAQLRDVLIEDYRVHLRNPSINITPLRKVLVLGAVRDPGPQEVNPTQSLLAVLAAAGGATSSGTLDHVQIVRDGDVIVEHANVEFTLGALGIRSGDQIVVQQRSWLARNRGFVVSLLLAVPSVIFTISRIDFGS